MKLPASPFECRGKPALWNQRLLAAPPKPLLALDNHARAALEAFERALASGRIQTFQRSQCWCGGTELQTLANRDRYGLPFSSALCASCGQVHQDRVFTLEGAQAYRHHFSATLDPGDDLVPTQANLPTEYLPDVDHLNVLWVGAQPSGQLGQLGVQAAARGQLTCASSLQDNLPNASYHLIILDGALERSSDLPAAIATVRTRLAAGGLVHVRTQGLMSLHNRADLWFDYLRYRIHSRVWEFSLSTLAHVMSAHGFQLIQGDEQICAVFTRGTGQIQSEESAQTTRAYLALCELNRECWTEREQECRNHLGRIQALERAIDANHELIDRLETKIDRLTQSASWKVTTPLRHATSTVRKLLWPK